MTNDNIHVTNAQMAEASALSLDAVYDEDGNLIPNPTQEDWENYTQREADIGIVQVDPANTSH